MIHITIHGSRYNYIMIYCDILYVALFFIFHSFYFIAHNKNNNIIHYQRTYIMVQVVHNDLEVKNYNFGKKCAGGVV